MNSKSYTSWYGFCRSAGCVTRAWSPQTPWAGGAAKVFEVYSQAAWQRGLAYIKCDVRARIDSGEGL
ncbi:MAG: hypothetical protein ACFNZW_09310 [Coriobacteriaceae bacterium]